MFAGLSTKKSKFASHKLITTRSVTLVYLLPSKALLCGIRARDQALQRTYSASVIIASKGKE